METAHRLNLIACLDQEWYFQIVQFVADKKNK